MINLITLASEYAIDKGIEKITMDTIKNSGYTKPSMRKNFEDMVRL